MLHLGMIHAIIVNCALVRKLALTLNGILIFNLKVKNNYGSSSPAMMLFLYATVQL
jgi:hypothetical protein